MKSVIEISAAALRANLRALGGAYGSGYSVLAVVKANAYGHGAALAAPVLVQAGVRWLGVADREEALELKAALRVAGALREDLHIVVMCGFEPEDAAGLLAEGLTPVVWTADGIALLDAAAAQAGTNVPVHLEIDTGMARQGAAPGRDLAAVLDALRASPHVRCEGVFSHLSSSECARSDETCRQRALFAAGLEQISAAAIIPEWIHLGNTSAGDEGSVLDWLAQPRGTAGTGRLWRPGLALYGYALPLTGPGASSRFRSNLKPVATWTTKIIGLREIEPGSTVGYGATFRAATPMRLALLPVGYADGLRREASSGVGDGWVMLGGRRAPVVGRVSMNLTVVDVTDHGEVALGDTAVLLGPGVTAEDHARWAGTIPYEILCGMRGHRRLV